MQFGERWAIRHRSPHPSPNDFHASWVLRVQSVKDRSFYDSPFLEMFEYDALEEARRYVRIPDPLGIHDNDRSPPADAEARCFATLHPCRAEEKLFALQQRCEVRVERTSLSAR